jgi:hypothetical protein
MKKGRRYEMHVAEALKIFRTVCSDPPIVELV